MTSFPCPPHAWVSSDSHHACQTWKTRTHHPTSTATRLSLVKDIRHCGFNRLAHGSRCTYATHHPFSWQKEWVRHMHHWPLQPGLTLRTPAATFSALQVLWCPAGTTSAGVVLLTHQQAGWHAQTAKGSPSDLLDTPDLRRLPGSYLSASP